jgi:hypothetical protein
MTDAGESTPIWRPPVLPPPQVLALNVCDFIVIDPWTAKRTLIGLFSIVHAQKFPAFHPVLSVHASLTNGHGNVTIKVRLIDSEEARPAITEVESTIDFTDPRLVVDFQGTTMNIVFPEPGEYRVQLFGNGELLSERRIVLFGAPEASHE